MKNTLDSSTGVFLTLFYLQHADISNIHVQGATQKLLNYLETLIKDG